MVAERGSPCDVAEDMAGVVKNDSAGAHATVRCREEGGCTRVRVSGRVWGQIAETSERDEVDGCDWMATASLAGKVTNCKTSEENVEDARLVSPRNARKRQRKIAIRLRLRLGDEEQSAVGTMESPEADLECSGMLDGLAANLEYPLQSGSGWCGMETDSRVESGRSR